MRDPRTLLVQTLGVLVILVLSLAQSPAAQATMKTLTIHLVGLGSPAITGVVSVIPLGQLCGNSGSPDGTATCTVTISAGTAIRLTSNSPSTPGVFSLGTGDAAACATSTCAFTINNNSEVTATLDPAAPVLTSTINLAGDGGGEVNADNSRCQNFDYDPAHLPTQFSACTTTYAPNSIVTLQAQPPVASRFAGFSDGTNNAAGVCAAGASCSFVLNANTSVTATFNALTSIAVLPLSDTINVNQSRLFTANGTFSDGVTEPIPTGMGTWVRKASMPTPRFDLAAAVAGGQIYAIGGDAPSSCGPGQPPPCSGPSNIVEAYNPSSNDWTTKAPMLTPRDGLGVGTIDGQIYAVGGSQPGPVPGSFIASLDVYDPGSNTWTPRDPMPGGPRGFMAAAVVNGKLYAIGGQDATGVLGRVEEYDPNAIPSATWTSKASMPTSRRWLGVGVVNGIIYAVGGDNAGASPSTIEGTKVEAYDPVSDTWATKAPLPDGGRTILSVAAIDNVLYALGGQSQFLRSSVFAYDTVTDNWSNKTFIPTLETQISPLQFFSGARGESAAVAWDGRVYLMGGYESSTSPPTSLPIVFAFTDNLIWSTSDPFVATINNQPGQATGRHAGTTFVNARTGPLTCANQCATLTVTNVVANTPPTVTIFGMPAGAPAVTINAGQSISTGGSFRDPDSGQTWTATVNYGDGSGMQPLALGAGNPPNGPTGTFSLNHTYVNADNYTAMVTVRDSAGGSASAALKVTVNGVQNQIFLGLPSSTRTEVNSGNWGCGSFFDQNAAGGSWSATVDYGDGSGVQPLPLVVPPSGPCYQSPGPTPQTGVFAFTHAYSATGTYSVNVTVTNTARGTSKSGSFTVDVQPPRECAQVTLAISGTNVPFASVLLTVTFGGRVEGPFEVPIGVNTFTTDPGTYHLEFAVPPGHPGYIIVPSQADFTVACGGSATVSAQVVLPDTTPPVIASVTPSTGVMWPPNHKMVGVIISALATDNVDASPVCTIQSVASNEPIDGLGDGDTAPDWLITGPLTLNLRSERQGGGAGRVYTILVGCSDQAGNTSTKTTQVVVPHDKGE